MKRKWLDLLVSEDLLNLISSNPNIIYEKEDEGITSLLYSGYTLLHIVASKNVEKASELIISKDKNTIYAKDNHCRTPLHYAAENNADKVSELIISKDINIMYEKNNSGSTPLHYAAMNNADRVSELIISKDKNTVYEKDNHGNTPLHIAAENNADKVSELIISKDKNTIYAKDNNCRTPLHYSAENNADKVSELIISKDINTMYEKDNQGYTPLHIASKEIMENINEHLINRIVILGDYEAFQDFFTSQFFPKFLKENYIQKYFELAVYHNQIKILEKLTLKFKKEMKVCLTENKQNILHIAAINGQIEMCKIILKLFPETLKLKNEKQKTALDLICQYGHIELYEIFSKEIEIPNSNFKTPLHYASEEGYFTFCSKIIEINPKWTTMKDSTGSTPLHLAASNGHIEVVRLLLHSIPPEMVDSSNLSGNTPLDCAMNWEQTEVIQHLQAFNKEFKEYLSKF